MLFDYANRAFMPQRHQNSTGSGSRFGSRSGSGSGSRFGSRSGTGSRSRTVQSGLIQRANNLIGRQVKINRGGPDMVEGQLVAIPADFMVVSTKDGIVYVNAVHVKSITETGQSGGTTGNRSGNRSRSAAFITASSFRSLLSKLRHQFIQINRGGPEKIDGFLAEINSDSLLVVVNREIIRIPVFHIKTVNVSGKGKNNNGNSSKNGNNKSGNNKSGNKNKSGNRSNNRSGNRSGGRSGNRSGSHSGNRSGNRSR